MKSDLFVSKKILDSVFFSFSGLSKKAILITPLVTLQFVL